MSEVSKRGTVQLVRAARHLLDVHNRAVAADGTRSTESDIRASICNLFEVSGLARREDMALESDRIDLRTGQAIIEVKRRIGRGAIPDPRHVEQLDGYLSVAREKGDPERLGILTDGKHWALRPSSEIGNSFDPTAGERTFTIITEADTADWVNWLIERIDANSRDQNVPTPEAVRHAFGIGLSAKNEIAELRQLFDSNASNPSVRVKRGLWEDLLGSALGEVVSETEDLDGLFVRHTYLATATALALQASFRLDINSLAQNEPYRLIDGTTFAETVSVKGVIESDFFGWPTEISGGEDWIRGLTGRVARFDWKRADYDIGSVLYQSIISADERRELGEYYTPDWLAEKIVEATVDEPLEQRVLDPSCGSGTFLRAAIKAYVAAAKSAAARGNLFLDEALVALQHKVVGVDVHPVAVHLARVSWVLAARELIHEAPGVTVSVPVYLGDSLQLRSDPNTLFSPSAVTVHVDSSLTHDSEVVLEFPKTLVDNVDEFDSLLREAADHIEAGIDPVDTLHTHEIADSSDREMLLSSLTRLKQLHDEGRNHIWAYYARNLVRPFWLSTQAGQVDRIVGNPPWLTYNKTVSSIRVALQTQAKDRYSLWPERQYITHADLAGLFFSRCVDLYLRFGGKAAMVMPHSALAAGQYQKWRTGNWGPVTVDLTKVPWDLEPLEPNDFFPIPACVIFASKSPGGGGLSTSVDQWQGSPYEPEKFTHKYVDRPDASAPSQPSPYKSRASQGATIVPRRLFFVTTRPASRSLKPGFSEVTPLSSSYDKNPWKSLDLSMLDGTMPDSYIHDIHRGDTLAPFVTLEPMKAILPLSNTGTSSFSIDTNTGNLTHACLVSLPTSVRHRWSRMSEAWESNRKPTSELTLLRRLNYWNNLSEQVPQSSLRLVYSSSGRPTAAVLEDSDAFIDYTMFWIQCRSIEEANYLAAVINSYTLYAAVKPLMSKGQFGPRHLQKHLWKLNLPEYDANNVAHRQLARLGGTAAIEARESLAILRSESTSNRRTLTADHARKVLRAKLAKSKTGRKIETVVKQLSL